VYFGFNAGVRAIEKLTTSTANYYGELEATKIGLQTVLSAVTGTGWEHGAALADEAFEKIRKAAIKSPAEAMDMFQIFQGIVGPIMAAGKSMQFALDMTNDTTLAASQLHIPYDEASHAVSMMSRGAAGMHVPLFGLLRSMSLIKEEAREFNALPQAQRVNKLADALMKFRSSGAAFESSWVGVASSLADIYKQARNALATPIMQMLVRRLLGVSNNLQEHQRALFSRLAHWGQTAAIVLEKVWDRGALVAQYVIDHWDGISTGIQRSVHALRVVGSFLYEHRHALLEIAKIYIGLKVAMAAIGAVLLPIAAMLRMASLAKGLFLPGLATATTAAATTGAVAGAEGTGALAAGAVGAGAATEGAVATGMAAVGAGAAGAAVSLPLVATALVAVASTAEPMIDNWQTMKKIVVEATIGLVQSAIGFGMELWRVARGPLYLLGSVVLTVGHIIATGLVTGLRMILTVGTALLCLFEPLGKIVYEWILPAFREMAKVMLDVTDAVNWAFNRIRTQADLLKHMDDRDWGLKDTLDTAGKWVQTKVPLPKQHLNVHNDFRGSNIKIDQKFEGDQDPDRVVVAMMKDLTRQAEMRLSSGYAGAFTR